MPCVIRWPGQIPAGSVSNELQAHEDLYLTLATAAGLTGIKEKLLTGANIGSMTYKVHLDGYDNTALWTGQSQKSARREFYYYDETDLMALRVDNWKLAFGVKNKGLCGIKNPTQACLTSSISAWTPWRRWTLSRTSSAMPDASS